MFYEPSLLSASRFSFTSHYITLHLHYITLHCIHTYITFTCFREPPLLSAFVFYIKSFRYIKVTVACFIKPSLLSTFVCTCASFSMYRVLMRIVISLKSITGIDQSHFDHRLSYLIRSQSIHFHIVIYNPLLFVDHRSYSALGRRSSSVIVCACANM